jgi:ubiquinone/menaquinone biosynthesis C-methylase UbiE
MEQIEKSYQRQAVSDLEMELPSLYTRPESVDNWRHMRMLRMARTIWELYPGSRWMTVGDGRFGSDAAYLYAQGVDVLATNLTEAPLLYAKEHGHIAVYQIENAERLSMPDNAVDFVLCKESYHHFPRPPIALYEMLRVSRVAVVMIEPLDDPRILDGIKRLFKTVIRGDKEQQFEDSGNFLYRLNIREMEKLMTAAGGEVMAFKGINDFWHPRLGDYAADSMNFGSLATRFGIAVQNSLSAIQLLGLGLGCVVIFKGNINRKARVGLRAGGFKIIDLPRNPYLVQ